MGASNDLVALFFSAFVEPSTLGSSCAFRFREDFVVSTSGVLERVFEEVVLASET